MIFDIISFVLLLGTISLLTVVVFIEKKKKAAALAAFIQSEKKKKIIAAVLQDLLEEKDSNSIEQTDGFLKFVSESRDWAFSYIESVQEALSVFDKKISSIITYYSTYGASAPGLHNKLIEEVSEAYSDLKSVLPKDENKV